MRIKVRKIHLVKLLLATSFFTCESAYALEINSPYIESGMIELETQNTFVSDNNSSRDNFRQHKLAVGYGVNDFWGVELEGELEKESGHGYKYSATEFSNCFQLTETGEYWADLGAKFSYEIANSKGSADKLEGFLLVQKNFSKFSSIANIGMEKEIGSNSNGNPEAEIKLLTRYNYQSNLNPAIEYYGSFGEISHSGGLDEQSHKIGPALSGKLWQGVKYDVATLFGLSKSAGNFTLKLNLEYEFPY